MATGNIGIVIHHYRPEVIQLAQKALAWCEQAGREQAGSEDEFVGCLPIEDAAMAERPELGVDDDEFGRNLEMCISLGGDGTMLRTTSLVSEHEVPVLGINAGHLGYLTEIDPSQMEMALSEWREGRLQVEERMMLEVRVDGDPSGWVGFALNEVVLERLESGHTIQVGVTVGTDRFTTYRADGLIIATPTGSTAYSLSAGGPIVEPDFSAILLTPVAAHMVFNRTLVLAPSTEVRLKVEGYRNAVVVLDGNRALQLEPGMTLTCRASTRKARLLVRGNRDFHTVLKEKFSLGDD